MVRYRLVHWRLFASYCSFHVGTVGRQRNMFQGFNPRLLQVDLLKSTALPLMKKFGIDGEGFDLKVRKQWWHIDKNGMMLKKFTFTYSAAAPCKKKSSLYVLLLPQVVKRGMAPGGGGEVVFTCPVRRTIRPVQLTDPGKIKRIRGVAYPSHAHNHSLFHF